MMKLRIILVGFAIIVAIVSVACRGDSSSGNAADTPTSNAPPTHSSPEHILTPTASTSVETNIPENTATPPLVIATPSEDPGQPPSQTTSQLPRTSVLFLVDKSKSIEDYCSPEQNAIRFQLPEFLITLVHANHSQSDDARIRLGVSVFPADAGKDNVLPLEALSAYSGSDWYELLERESQSYEPGRGYTEALQDAANYLNSQFPNDNKVIFLITDGYLGFDATEEQRTELGNKVEEIGRTYADVELRVILINCNDLVAGLANEDFPYHLDLRLWDGLAYRKHLSLFRVDSIGDAVTEIVQQAKDNPEDVMAPLLPLGSTLNRSGWGWVRGGTNDHSEPKSETWSVLGNARQMNITVVAVGGNDFWAEHVVDTDKHGPHIFIRRGDFRPVYQVTKDLVPNSECSKSTWIINGSLAAPNHPKSFIALYWWKAEVPSLSVNLIVPEGASPLENNGMIRVEAEVRNGRQEFNPCYRARLWGYRVDASGDKEKLFLLPSEQQPFGNRLIWEVQNYSRLDSYDQLEIFVELFRPNSNHSDSTQSVFSESVTLDTIFRPDIVARKPCDEHKEGEACIIEISFDYLGPEFHRGERFSPSVYVASSTNSDDLLQEPDCESILLSEDISLNVPSELELEIQYVHPIEQKPQLDNSEEGWSERADGQFQIGIPDFWKNNCDFGTVILQWGEHRDWTVSCDLEDNEDCHLHSDFLVDD